MSIPERLYRLAKGKVGELRDLFDHEDDDIDPELLARVQRAQNRHSARQELDDAVSPLTSPGSPTMTNAPAPRSSVPLRSPEQIAGTAQGAPVHSTADPLAPHYHLLGLEPGTDFAAVQFVYEKLAARCKPERFPAGSTEAVELQDIRTRLEAAYKALREALDPTARRFDMLEI